MPSCTVELEQQKGPQRMDCQKVTSRIWWIFCRLYFRSVVVPLCKTSWKPLGIMQCTPSHNHASCSCLWLQKDQHPHMHFNSKHLCNADSHIGRSHRLKVTVLHSPVPDKAHLQLIMYSLTGGLLFLQGYWSCSVSSTNTSSFCTIEACQGDGVMSSFWIDQAGSIVAT